MERVYNFSAGPAILPLEVLKQVQKEMLVHKENGMSVMEMSHRSPMYDDIITKAEEDFRKLMNISDEYGVIFMQGGASLQFAAVPMNLSQGRRCLYVDSGAFASKAISEAKRYADVDVIASSKEDKYTYIPKITNIDEDASYLHITTNNTIYGTSYKELPFSNSVELVADMSSEICGNYRDVSKFGLIYAGAQKNLGPAGLTIVIVKKSLLGKQIGITPTMMNYKTMYDKNSMYNTPATYSIYVAGLNFAYLLKNGGVKAAQAKNEKKAALLYKTINESKLYNATVKEGSESIMNVTFTLCNDDLTAGFIDGAAKIGLVNIKGHRVIGGVRASIYNAMPYEGVKKLSDYMIEFEKNN